MNVYIIKYVLLHFQHRPNNLVARWRRRKDQPEPPPTESTAVAKA